MQKKSCLFITLLILSTLVPATSRADIEWSGVYRFEGNFLKNSELGDQGKELTYGLHHLVLRPKIVAGDGLTIYGQFNILNESNNYPNSQIGQIWGNGVRGSTAKDKTASGKDSNVISQTQASEMIDVTQLYLTWSQEFSQLIVGRAPLHFGLGMTYNAGRGLFDHWYDTRDMLGFKIVMGNLYVLPMFGKPSEGAIGNNDDLNDYMIQVQYENPETDMEMGLFYSIRSGGDQASDAPAQGNTGVGLPGPGALGGAGALATGSVDMKTFNLYVLRNTTNFRLGLEASFQSGETGVKTASGDNVSLNGFGIATELGYSPEGSKWNLGLKAGTATGDDPNTDATYEGFIFDRNYDIGMLMFNHPLGQADFLRTDALTGGTRTAGIVDKADVEALSNVLYFAPSVKYVFNDRWNLENTLITGWLGTSPIAGKEIDKGLGYEWDISLNFTPRKGVTWVNQAGVLFPGSAWEGADSQYDSSFAYGFKTKAAISF